MRRTLTETSSKVFRLLCDLDRNSIVLLTNPKPCEYEACDRGDAALRPEFNCLPSPASLAAVK
jgi:hypothetical protein